MSPPNINSKAMIARTVAIFEKKLIFLRNNKRIGVINTKYRLTTLDVTTESSPCEPISTKTLKPVRRTAKNAPFKNVFFFIFNNFFALTAKRTTTPMRLVMHTNEKVDTD